MGLKDEQEDGKDCIQRVWKKSVWLLIICDLLLLVLSFSSAYSGVRSFLISYRNALFSTFTNDKRVFALEPPALLNNGFKTDSTRLKNAYEKKATLSRDIGSLHQESDNDKAITIVRLMKHGGFESRYSVPLEKKIDNLLDAKAIGYCSDYSEVFIALSHISGLTSREMQTANHGINEFFDRTRRKWVFVDATLSLVARDEKGQHLSLLEMKEMIDNGKEISFESLDQDKDLNGLIKAYYGDKRIFSRLVMTMGNNVFEENRFNQKYSYLPKPVRSFYGNLTGILPKYLVYVDSSSSYIYMHKGMASLSWIFLCLVGFGNIVFVVYFSVFSTRSIIAKHVMKGGSLKMIKNIRRKWMRGWQ